MKYDSCVIGGGIIGSAVAYFLKRLDPSAAVSVIEPDPTFEFASTLRASGGARRLFSRPENIRMSNFSIEFIKGFDREIAAAGGVGAVDWRENGYLFVVPPEGVAVLEQNAALQRELGVEVVLLDAGALKARYPSIRVDDVGAAAWSPRDGWCDPNGFLQGLRSRCRALGVETVTRRVTDFTVAGNLVRGVVLEGGERLAADAVVIAAGAWSPALAARVDMPLPIAPMRRFEHFFTIQTPIEPLPFVKDLARLAFRPEGNGYTGSLVNSNEPRGFNFAVDESYFPNVVWPALAHRFPAFEATRCHRSWSGLYEQCELDGNPIIGNWKGHRDNVFVVAGFSGHGLMHAPAAGRAVAELIAYGEFRSIDLGRLGYERVVGNRPYPELGIL